MEVTGSRDGAYTYDIYFQVAADAARPTPCRRRRRPGKVVVPQSSVARLVGARLDWSDEGEGGLVILNPNTPPRTDVFATVRPVDLSGDMAQRVLAILEEQVNPSIAMHGGRADLVAVEEDVVYLRLSGGCQGCGLATVTLSQGIEVALRDAVARDRVGGGRHRSRQRRQPFLRTGEEVAHRPRRRCVRGRRSRGDRAEANVN